MEAPSTIDAQAIYQGMVQAVVTATVPPPARANERAAVKPPPCSENLPITRVPLSCWSPQNICLPVEGHSAAPAGFQVPNRRQLRADHQGRETRTWMLKQVQHDGQCS